MDSCTTSSFILLLTFLNLSLFTPIRAAPATNTQLPPLQWLEITNRFSGSSPPGLSYASIGFDATSGTLIIFGGESNGFPQQQTYLLNVSSLSWSSPNPPASLADIKPPPRSMAISGGDFAASNRHGHVVIGGKDQNGQPLSDAWEFDYINQFWSNISISPGGPSPRYSVSGGIDVTSAAVADPSVAGPNNTFYLAGGYDGQITLSLSDVWEFEVAGVLSANNANNVDGSWKQVQFPDSLPSRVRQGGTVMPSAMVVAAGGCSSADTSDNSCAQQDSHVLNINAIRDISPDGCPAPRVGPVIVPNFNTFSSSFATQAFMLLGTFNNSLWDDGGGLNRGEVAVLDIDTGVWTRVIPSGDPSSGTVKYPVPREGAAAFASAHALVGSNPSVGSDILVFGGKDANGNYLADVWLLRGYQGQITETNASWSGFGDGSLGSGVDASGTGVKLEYLTSCAQARSPSATSSASNPSSTSPSTPTPTGSSGQRSVFPYDTKTSHKASSPVSVALLLAALVFYRMSMPSTAVGALTGPRVSFIWLAGLTGFAAYAVGIAGMVFAFTSVTLNSGGILKRSSTSLFLNTDHGKAGLAFFVILYGLLPLLFVVSFFTKDKGSKQAIVNPDQVKERDRQDSNETGFTALMSSAREKASHGHQAAASSPDITTQTTQPDSPVVASRTRRRSFFGGLVWYGYKKERHSTESSGAQESVGETGPKRSFEVLNRGGRARRLSGTAWNARSSEGGHSAQPSVPRSLSDLNWLDRRQNVAAFGELDYALTHVNRAQAATPIGDLHPTSSIPQPRSRPALPSPHLSVLHVLLHAAILGICIVVLDQLWQRAPKAAFAVFLIWTIALYSILFFLAWRGMPRASILAVLLSSLRYHQEVPQAPDPHSTPSSRPMSRNELYAFPSEPRSPYTFHQLPVRRAFSTQEDDLLSSNFHGEPRSDEDEDEETQQRRIEEEMARRDVSIVTVPKRKLWIANPS